MCTKLNAIIKEIVLTIVINANKIYAWLLSMWLMVDYFALFVDDESFYTHSPATNRALTQFELLFMFDSLEANMICETRLRKSIDRKPVPQYLIFFRIPVTYIKASE
uniref:Uncharacterized protein n=1 Tax=Glossina pallidipes TaxID=7398 RepID=A0A1A9ZZT1_GLOPL